MMVDPAALQKFDALSPVEREAALFRWLLREWFTTPDDSFVQCARVSDEPDLRGLIERTAKEDPQLGDVL